MRHVIHGILVLWLLCLAPASVVLAWPDAPPSKVTISGPGIDGEVDITDPEMLKGLKLGVVEDFDAGVLDSPGILEQGYRITLGFGDFRFGILTFYPRMSADKSYLLFEDGPDKQGDRTAYDGQWLLPTAQGEVLLNELVARAKNEPSKSPVPSIPTSAFEAPVVVPTPAPLKAPTAMPLPLGKRPIYIVDPSNGRLTSQVLVVDPDAGRVVKTIATRYAPEIAITPDGTKLYVADSHSSQVVRGEQHDVISVYDALTGNLLHDDVEIPDRLMYKLFPSGHPFMFFSKDGKRLFVGKYGDPGVHKLRLAVLDPVTLRTLGEYTRPECSLIPLQGGELLCVGYGQQPRLVDSLTGQPKSLPFSLPANYEAAVLPEAGNRLYLLFSDANSPLAMAVIDLHPTLRMVANKIELFLPPDSAVGYNHVAVAPDGSRLYVGFVPKSGDLSGRGLATGIWALDAASGARIGVFNPTNPAWQVAISHDGTQLYTVNPFERSLSVFDTSTFRELVKVHDLGDSPAFILVPPNR